jgi:hypothetical protein
MPLTKYRVATISIGIDQQYSNIKKQVLKDWNNSAHGKWVNEYAHSVEVVLIDDPEEMGMRIHIVAEFNEEIYTAYKLTWQRLQH